MALGGLVGEAAYEGDFEPFWPFLVFGQWTHVGKNATFGLGRYAIVGSDPALADNDREGRMNREGRPE